jgi:DNA-binding MarR family transcriptional regulator
MGTNIKDGTRVMDATRHLVRALAGASRAIQASSGISGAQLFVLRQLAGAEGPLSVNELAELTLTHQSTVSGVVTRLVERRLVSRTPAAEDARRMSIALTPRGRALVASAPATVQTHLVIGLTHLTAAQRSALADGLEAWLAAAGLGGDAAPLFFESDTEPSARRAKRGTRRTARTK